MPGNPHTVRCPTCQSEVQIPSTAPQPPGTRRRLVVPMLAGTLLVAILLLAYRYSGHLTTLLLLANEATGSTTLSLAALGLMLLGAVCLAGWLLLPFLLAWVYWDLRRHLRSSPLPKPRTDCVLPSDPCVAPGTGPKSAP